MFKAETIQSAFRKTGIEPFDRDALDPAVFEPSLNTTIKSAQPLATTLPTYIPIKILPTGSNNENTHPDFDNIETTDQQTASRTPADDTTTPTDDTTRPTNDTTAPAPAPHPPVRFRFIIPQPFHIQPPERIFVHTIQTFLILFNVAGSRLKQTLLRCS